MTNYYCYCMFLLWASDVNVLTTEDLGKFGEAILELTLNTIGFLVRYIVLRFGRGSCKNDSNSG